MKDNPSSPPAVAVSAAASQDARPLLQAGHAQLRRIQFAFLFIVSCVILLMAPSHFHFQPDTGFYVGGADSLLTSGSYSFNGLPILIYYPGFSLLLAAPISLFGIDFQVLHLFAALWCVAALWLIRAYYGGEPYGNAGLLAPALLPFAGIFQEQVLYILSDAAFLAWTFLALLLWRHFLGSGKTLVLILCALVVAFVPLIRMQGIFLVAALGIGLLFHFWDKRRPLRQLSIAGGITLAVLLPFLLWTLRNYLQHSPDAYNMANSFFFDQEGLALYGSDFYRPEWIDARWKFGLMNLLYSVRDLAETLFGSTVTAWVRPEAIPMLLGIPLLLGLAPWWRRSSWVERTYVVISALFLVLWSLRSSSLYTVPRYWLPLLPFLLLIGLYGLGRIYELLRWRNLRPWLMAAYLSLLAVLVGQGTANALNRLEPWATHYYENSEATRLALAQVVHAHSEPGDVIAVTDWGVLPLSLDRATVSVLNDKDRVRSLDRIVDRQATHLVILEGTSAMVDAAKEMVAELPEVFHPVRVIDPDGPGAGGGVYRIDLQRAEAEMSKRAGR
jgi:4-amino-4-deoxy-L-arabinose transferase-like glycosyltransferase